MLNCPECGEVIRGRADKKYCSNQCRTSYHNKCNSDSINYMRNVNNLLRKNRRILVELNPRGKAKVSKNKMVKKGFNFNYFTNEFVTKQGNVYRFCYDQGYLKLEKEVFALVIRNNYVD